MTSGEREATRVVPTASPGNRGSSPSGAPTLGMPRDRRKPANERRAPLNFRAMEAETPAPVRRRYAGPRLSPLLMPAIFLGGQNLAILATGGALEVIYESG